MLAVTEAKVSELIRDALARLKKSQRWLSIQLGVSTKAVNAWTQGKTAPLHKNIARISEVLGIPLSELSEAVVRFSPSQVKVDLAPPSVPVTVNRRAELELFEYTRTNESNSTPLPQWLDLACGEGCDLERCDDLVYSPALDDFKGLHTAIVRGDSMLDTLHHGDLIILKPWNEDVVLRKLPTPELRTPMRVWRAKTGIAEGDICVLSINDEPPTLKRIHYDTRRGEKEWRLQIVADNFTAWYPYPVEYNDAVIFHAKMIGLGIEKKHD